jgi:hypothetical protein
MMISFLRLRRREGIARIPSYTARADRGRITAGWRSPARGQGRGVPAGSSGLLCLPARPCPATPRARPCAVIRLRDRAAPPACARSAASESELSVPPRGRASLSRGRAAARRARGSRIGPAGHMHSSCPATHDRDRSLSPSQVGARAAASHRTPAVHGPYLALASRATSNTAVPAWSMVMRCGWARPAGSSCRARAHGTCSSQLDE